MVALAGRKRPCQSQRQTSSPYTARNSPLQGAFYQGRAPGRAPRRKTILQPQTMVLIGVIHLKVYEPLLIVGLDKFANVDIRVRVHGGGHTSQIYAIRQAIAKSIVAYYQKYVDEYAKNQLKQALVQYDRTLLVADNRRCEPKKFGGKGARSRFQKSYR